MNTANDATIYAALLGAGFAALSQFIVVRRREHAQRHAVLNAIVAEVTVLTTLLRMQYRPEGLGRLDLAIAKDPKAVVFPLDSTGPIFTVYEGLSNRLGELKEEYAARIVEFYTFYEIALGLAAKRDDSCIDDALVDLLIGLGEKIAGFSRSSARNASAGTGPAVGGSGALAS